VVKLISDDPWQQLVDAIDRMLGDASDAVAQVGLGIKAAQFGSTERAPWLLRPARRCAAGSRRQQ